MGSRLAERPEWIVELRVVGLARVVVRAETQEHALVLGERHAQAGDVIVLSSVEAFRTLTPAEARDELVASLTAHAHERRSPGADHAGQA